MFVRSMLTTHAEVAEPVAWCDTNGVRMDLYDELLAEHGRAPLPRYTPGDFSRMLDEQDPDVVVVTSPDSTHARYVVEALDRGVDVVCEKPMTIDVDGLRAITEAARRSTAELVVTFNYRYSPRNSEVRRLVSEGAIGDVTSVTFEWLLDTVHGADYFRRWHREKVSSGGLLVHKSTHHLDLVNWWIDDVPEVVSALGRLAFYGEDSAAARGLGPRPALGRDGAADDPFALDMAADETLRRLYLEAEEADGYVRDRDVFGPGITIEDNLAVLVGYRGGPVLSYSLNAHSPWEGYKVGINGTRGRLELEVVERTHVHPGSAGKMLGPDGKKAPVVDPSVTHVDAAGGARAFGSRLVLQQHWDEARELPIPEGVGAHGGGDAMLLDDVFLGVGDDPLGRQAHYVDGVRSVIVGIAANASIRTGETVRLSTLGIELDAPDGSHAASAEPDHPSPSPADLPAPTRA